MIAGLGQEMTIDILTIAGSVLGGHLPDALL